MSCPIITKANRAIAMDARSKKMTDIIQKMGACLPDKGIRCL